MRTNGDLSSSIEVLIEGSSLLEEEEKTDEITSELVAVVMHVAMMYSTEGKVQWRLMTVQVSYWGQGVQRSHKLKLLGYVGSSY